ncbi:hypothetical protein C1H46_019546 [Malus baccata]|uniref:Uncharacterized protein n=1 Tax=Malus baccata TaxID=106549 RepID=A0A540M800_MALBA|nr:hypothetical protein C1H46_019546 [Malus baccata]
MARVGGNPLLFLFALPSLIFCYCSSSAIHHDQCDQCILDAIIPTQLIPHIHPIHPPQI